MQEDVWVWVVDATGRGYPFTRDAVALDPTLRVVEDHPVFDADGRLLPTEFPPADQAEPNPSDAPSPEPFALHEPEEA